MSKVENRRAGDPCWFDLMSDNVEKAKTFYKAIFGWDFVDGPPETGGYAMCVKNGAVVAGIGGRPPGAEYPSCWSVYFASDNLEADHARATELGGKVLMRPMDILEEGRMSMLMDPTGAAFGLWQAGRHRGSELENEHGSMAWCEVNTRQGEAARDFYANLLQLVPKLLDGVTYWVLSPPGAKVGEGRCGVMVMDQSWPENIPPHWMAYFAVDNMEAALQAVTENGGTVCVSPFDTPYGKIAVIGDPSNATFSIVKMPG